MLWLAGRGNGTGYLWGYRIEGGGDRAFTVEWKVPPAGTRAFVADLGLPNGQRMQVSYRFECGTAIAEGLLGPDDPPRTITLPVSECVLTVSASAPIGVGNPRWSRTAG
jgi:hypothetical protein